MKCPPGAKWTGFELRKRSQNNQQQISSKLKDRDAERDKNGARIAGQLQMRPFRAVKGASRGRSDLLGYLARWLIERTGRYDLYGFLHLTFNIPALFSILIAS